MKCPLCEDYFDRDKVTFQKLRKVNNDTIRVCPECYKKESL